MFLHGVAGSARTWEWLPLALRAGRRVIRLDLRGHGRSDHAPGTYRVTEYAADAIAVLAALCPGERATLVGHSLGGVVAWTVSQSRPDLVGAAFLEDPPLFAPNMDDPANGGLRRRFETMREAARAAQAAGISELTFAATIGTAAAGPDPDGPSLVELCFEDAVAARSFAQLRMDPGVLDGAIDGSTLAGVNLKTAVAVPVLVLGGDPGRGAVFTHAHAIELRRAQPRVEVVELAGCGHLIHEERSHRHVFADHLGRFLAGSRADAGLVRGATITGPPPPGWGRGVAPTGRCQRPAGHDPPERPGGSVTCSRPRGRSGRNLPIHGSPRRVGPWRSPGVRPGWLASC